MLVPRDYETGLCSNDRNEYSLSSCVRPEQYTRLRTHHCVENHIARAEADFIANTDNQYLVPTSGKPLRGLIQDHVVAGVWMCNKETFFTREEYNQLIYGALRPEDELLEGLSSRIKTLPPTIWKPRALWTGKQIVSFWRV